MIIGAVSDEITNDFTESVKIGLKRGITHYEIRSIDGFRFPFFPDCYYDILIRLKREYGLTYTSVSPGLFKRNVNLAYGYGYKEEIWKYVFTCTKKLDAGRIHIFSYEKYDSNDEYDRMIEDIRKFTKGALLNGFTVSLENSPSTGCVTGADLLRIIRDADCGGLFVNWDPGNAAIRGHIDYREGYEKIKDHIDNVHLKDVAVCENESGKYSYVPCGEGLMDLKGQINDLKQTGYTGAVVLETHCSPLKESFIRSSEYLKRIVWI